MVRILCGVLALLLGACVGGASTSDAPTATVAAAASLRTVMPALLEAWGSHATVTYGASGTLRRQVESGAPIDVVVFASATPVDDLIANGLAAASSRTRVATNELVLIRPAALDTDLTWRTLGSLPEGEKLAIGEPAAVPAGRYTKEALQGLGSWDALQDRIVFGGDVAMVLAYARRGEVATAAVYATDAQGLDDVVVLDRAGWDGAPLPEVVAAATSETASGRSFLAFLDTPSARTVFKAHGFGAP